MRQSDGFRSIGPGAYSDDRLLSLFLQLQVIIHTGNPFCIISLILRFLFPSHPLLLFPAVIYILIYYLGNINHFD